MDTLPFLTAIRTAREQGRKPVAWLFSREQRRFVMRDAELNNKLYAVERDPAGVVKLLGIPVETVDEPTHPPMLRTSADGRRPLLADPTEPWTQDRGYAACTLVESARFGPPLEPIPVELPS